MPSKFLGNTGTKKLHALGYTDGRCKIEIMREENKRAFDTYEQAMRYPEGQTPIFHECGICFPKMRQENQK